MPSMHYDQGASLALTKLGFLPEAGTLGSRLMHRGLAGAGLGALSSGMAGGGLLSGAAYGTAGGLLLGAVPRRPSGHLSQAAQKEVPARLERFQQYLKSVPHNETSRRLEEHALNRDYITGGIGGVLGGVTGRVIDGPSR